MSGMLRTMTGGVGSEGRERSGRPWGLIKGEWVLEGGEGSESRRAIWRFWQRREVAGSRLEACSEARPWTTGAAAGHNEEDQQERRDQPVYYIHNIHIKSEI